MVTPVDVQGVKGVPAKTCFTCCEKDAVGGLDPTRVQYHINDVSKFQMERGFQNLNAFSLDETQSAPVSTRFDVNLGVSDKT